MEVGFRIVIVSAGDSEFIERYTGIQNPGFQIPQARFSQISDSTSKNFADLGSGYSYTGKSASFYVYLKLRSRNHDLTSHPGIELALAQKHAQ